MVSVRLTPQPLPHSILSQGHSLAASPTPARHGKCGPSRRCGASLPAFAGTHPKQGRKRRLTRSQALINNNPTRFEVTAVYEHPEATVDIVLVHGFNGNPRKTWTAQNGVYWPTDLLPKTLGDRHANILVYGYNANAIGFPLGGQQARMTPSDNPLHQHAQTLVSFLTTHRQSKGTTRNPIIWVVHSLGGIITKRALLHSYEIQDPHLDHQRSIYVSTYGIIFLGTPHNGSNIAAWGGAAQKITNMLIPKMFLATETVLLKSLRKDHEQLQDIHARFANMSQRFEIHMAHENQRMDGKGAKYVGDAVTLPPRPTWHRHSVVRTESNLLFQGTSRGFRVRRPAAPGCHVLWHRGKPLQHVQVWRRGGAGIPECLLRHRAVD